MTTNKIKPTIDSPDRDEDGGNFELTRVLIGIALLGIFIGVVAFIVYAINFWGLPISRNPADWGPFGDYLGGVLNPILALLALIALLFTLHVQTKELAVARKEMRQSSRALIDQVDLMRRQNFENTFFRLLSLHHEIVDQIRYSITLPKAGVVNVHLPPPTKTTHYLGRDCFEKIYEVEIKSYFTDERFVEDGLTKKALADIYDYFYFRKGNHVGHYFRNLYQIFKFIKDSNIRDQKRFSSLVRAQLSNRELQLLFFNCLSGHGNKFRKYIADYALFENMPIEMLRDCPDSFEYYEKAAYGDEYDNLKTVIERIKE